MSGFSFGPAIGLWTPTFVGTSTPGAGQTYAGQTGSYELIGRLVIARFNVIATSLGTAAGNLQIGGLPFVNGSEVGYAVIPSCSVVGFAASNFGVGGTITAATSLILLGSNNNTGNSAVSVAQAGGTCFFQGTAIYHV